MQIKLAGLVPESIVDGPGYRFAIFAQGCHFKCFGCHNPHTWDFDGGKLYDTADIIERVKQSKLTDGVTFTGGEPFCQPEAFLELAKELHTYNIYCFTGYNFEDLIQSDFPAVQALLSRINVLIDGGFKASEFNYQLKFKGSRNQRILDCRESVKQGKAVILTENNN